MDSNAEETIEHLSCAERTAATICRNAADLVKLSAKPVDEWSLRRSRLLIASMHGDGHQDRGDCDRLERLLLKVGHLLPRVQGHVFTTLTGDEQFETAHDAALRIGQQVADFIKRNCNDGPRIAFSAGIFDVLWPQFSKGLASRCNFDGSGIMARVAAESEAARLATQGKEIWSPALPPKKWLAIFAAAGRNLKISLDTFSRRIKDGTLAKHPDSKTKSVRIRLDTLPQEVQIFLANQTDNSATTPQ
ncbi:MAG TPA: hypothetical protein VGM05_13135 [Planctomycetaceae bacterium]|jgi:hypothetical protein